MIKWMIVLIGTILVFLGMYLVYNIGLNEGVQSKNEKTIVTIAKESKAKKALDVKNYKDNNISQLTSDISIAIVTTYEKSAKGISDYYNELDINSTKEKVSEYYKKIEFPEMNSTKDKVEDFKNYVIDFWKGGIQGAKNSYEKMTKKEEKLDKKKETE